jgi:hypothetical protein
MEAVTNPQSAKTEDILNNLTKDMPGTLDKLGKMAKDFGPGNSNPYPDNPKPRKTAAKQLPAKQPYRGPKPLKSGQPIQNPPTKADTLNALGQGFRERHPTVPIDQIKIASTYIMNTYQSLGEDKMVQIMNRMFLLLQNIRDIGVNIRRIKDGTPYPVIDRPLTPKDAAEWLMKEKPKIAERLAQMQYEEIIGMLAPFQDHPMYKDDCIFIARPEVAEILEEILDEIRKINSPK